MTTHLLLSLTCLFLISSCNSQSATEKIANIKVDRQRVQGDTVNEFGNSIMVLHQAKNGDYWFGSWQTGLYRYDGKSIVNYRTQHGLPNNRIDQIEEDAAGNLLFVSCHPYSTVVKFDGNIFSTLSPVVSTDWRLESSDLWFKHAYRNERVYRYDGSTLHDLLVPKPPKLNNPFEIYSIYKDGKGNVWFGTNPVGVCRYNGESFDWITEEDVTEFRDEGANGVRSVLEDRKGDFWFNTEYRYSVYNQSDSTSDQFYIRHPSIGGLDGEENSGLNEYLSSVKDDEGNLWFVTYLDGVWKYDGENITHFPVQVDAKNIALFKIYKDHAGDLWLGSHEHGVYRFDGDDFVRFRL